jgi:hypothetical protein
MHDFGVKISRDFVAYLYVRNTGRPARAFARTLERSERAAFAARLAVVSS